MYVISVKFLWSTFLDSGEEHSKLDTIYFNGSKLLFLRTLQIRNDVF